MNWLLKKGDMLERARDLSRTNLLFIFGIIKAASIGVGVTVFMQLFFDLGGQWQWIRIADQLPKFLHWTVTYLCLIVTFDSAMFATLFMVHIPKKAESFWTFMLVGLETLQFAFLSPAVVSRECVKMIMSVETFGWWYAVFFCYCIAIFMLIFHARAEISESQRQVESDARPMISLYLSAFRGALTVVLIAACLVLSVFVLHIIFQGDSHMQYLIELSTSLGLLCLIWLFFVFQHKQRDEIERLLVDKSPHPELVNTATGSKD